MYVDEVFISVERGKKRVALTSITLSNNQLDRELLQNVKIVYKYTDTRSFFGMRKPCHIHKNMFHH